MCGTFFNACYVRNFFVFLLQRLQNHFFFASLIVWKHFNQKLKVQILYHFELFGRPLSPAHWPWLKSVTCPLSSTRFDPILTTVGQTNIKKLPNLGLIVTIYSRWPIAKFCPCCPLSPWPSNSKWYSTPWIVEYDPWHVFVGLGAQQGH